MQIGFVKKARNRRACDRAPHLAKPDWGRNDNQPADQAEEKGMSLDAEANKEEPNQPCE
jgi:hypothetical protein